MLRIIPKMSQRDMLRIILLLFFLFPLLVPPAFPVGNEPVNTLPVQSNNQPTASFMQDLRSFLNQEDAARYSRLLGYGQLSTGGYHGPIAGMTSPSFAAEGFDNTGNRMVQQATVINYTTVGCAANDTAWVILSSRTENALDNFQRVTGTDYFVDCVNTAQPLLPTGSTWLLKATIVTSTITATSDLSTRRIVAPYAPTVPVTQDPTGHWIIEPNGRVELATGVTIALAGCLTAGIHQVFTGADVLTGVTYMLHSPCTTIRPQWWGAQGDATTDGQQVFFNAASESLSLSGGTILGGGPGQHYKFNDRWLIKHSHITFDGQGSRLSGAPGVPPDQSGLAPVIFASPLCGQACSGDSTALIENVHLLNYNVGIDATFPQDQMRGGVLNMCRNCSMQRISVKTTRGTTFTAFWSDNCTLRDLRIENGSNDQNASFATIITHSNDCLVDNWYARGAYVDTGPCCFVLQVKTGTGNRINNATIEHADSPAVDFGGRFAFLSRGDAPWAASNTNPENEPYRYPTNPNMPPGQEDCTLNNCYLAPDARRANSNTQWTNLAVRNSPNLNCFNTEEGAGDKVTGIDCEDVRNGILCSQDPGVGSQDRNCQITNFEVRRVGLDAAVGDGRYGIYLNGQGNMHPDGTEAAVNNFRGMRIGPGIIQNTAGPGINIEDASDVLVHGVIVESSNQIANGDLMGIWVSRASKNITLSNNTIRNMEAVPLITQGIRVAETVSKPILLGNRVECPNCAFGTFRYYRALPVGRYTQNTPAFCTARTTDEFFDIQSCVILTHDGDRFKITTKCVARRNSTNQAYFERTAFVEDNGGILTVVPNTSSGDITFRPNPNWDVEYEGILEELRIKIKGDAGETVDWFCDPDIIDMDLTP